MVNPVKITQKVVIVDDNVSLVDIYKLRLEAIGYTCFGAYDGEEALAVIEREQPQLVLLDLMLPKLSGGDVLKKMRSHDWGRDIKVFIISNIDEVDAPHDLRNHKIEGYAVKATLQDDEIDKLVGQILTPAI